MLIQKFSTPIGWTATPKIKLLKHSVHCITVLCMHGQLVSYRMAIKWQLRAAEPTWLESSEWHSATATTDTHNPSERCGGRGCYHTWHTVYHYKSTVSDAQSCCHFGGEIDVTRGVNEVNEEARAILALFDEGHVIFTELIVQRDSSAGRRGSDT